MQDGDVFNPYKKFLNAWVPLQVLASIEISHGAKLLYGLLSKYAGENGLCIPKQKRLAKEMGCSRRNIQYYLDELKKAKLVQVHRPSGHRRSCRYEFLWKNELRPCQKALSDAQPTYTTCEESFTPPSLYEEVPSKESLYRNSSSRACGNVENFDSAPESAAIEVNQTEVGTSEQPAGEQCGEVLECGGNAGRSENEDVLGGKLARDGWKVVRLGNQTPKDTDVSEGLRIRNSIRELAWSKRMDKRR